MLSEFLVVSLAGLRGSCRLLGQSCSLLCEVLDLLATPHVYVSAALQG